MYGFIGDDMVVFGDVLFSLWYYSIRIYCSFIIVFIVVGSIMDWRVYCSIYIVFIVVFW